MAHPTPTSSSHFQVGWRLIDHNQMPCLAFSVRQDGQERAGGICVLGWPGLCVGGEVLNLNVQYKDHLGGFPDGVRPGGCCLCQISSSILWVTPSMVTPCQLVGIAGFLQKGACSLQTIHAAGTGLQRMNVVPIMAYWCA